VNPGASPSEASSVAENIVDIKVPQPDDSLETSRALAMQLREIQP
jgi:hypothetical protein